MKWKVACAVLAFATTALAVLALVQWGELRRQGMPPDWGDVPAWVAAFGSLATFGALSIAALEWRSRQADRRLLDADRRAADRERSALAAAREAERRDHEMSQARLIVAQPIDNSLATWSGPTRPDMNNAKITVVNFSSEPVFNLQFVKDKDDELQVLQHFNGAGQEPTNYPVFAAAEKTAPLTVIGRGGVPSVECVEFTFTDARGLQWLRRGSGLPTRIGSGLQVDRTS